MRYLLIILLLMNFIIANKSYSINLAFPVNDEFNQITIRKDFKLSDKLYFCSSLGFIFNPINIGFKYEENYNHKGFVFYSGMGYTPSDYFGPGLFYHFSPSYQWKFTKYIYLNFGVNYNIYYDFEKLYIPKNIEGERLSGIIPFLQLSIKY